MTAAVLVLAATASADEFPPTIAMDGILRGTFSQERHLAGFKAPLRSEGSFVLAPERGLIWRVEKPFPTVTIVTPAGLIQKSNGTELVRLSASHAPQFTIVYRLIEKSLQGDWQGLRDRYEVRTGRDGEKWRVDLKPRDGAGSGVPFETADITGGRFVETVALHKAGGDVDLMRFAGQALSSGPLHPDEATLFAAVPR